ncbi:ATP-binding cassette domain-containing protein [Streptomyces purpurascens]|uniref:ATP-binding cassette domain-containing protein n=1 Tax=Streptomyces purpurascens TaxID=1924 RepID=A0ABZ1MKX5_STREF|nr:ATP-binding cassette domain-containing protein [Streptomyces purpurascens]MCE7049090.1 ATP-binding cassette domain-containing protein [Streptomyces purpurascens]
MTAPMIEARRVGRTFGRVRALDDVSLTVGAGSVLGLLGHNGAGKTTLVDILTTVLPPTSGSATVAGHDVVGQGHQVRRRIGLTGQFAAVDDRLTGYANLLLVARLLGASPRQAARRSEELLALFGLEHAARRPARTYSGGMRRRLDLAIGLVGRPDVLFLDEPTTGLDPESRMRLWEIVERLAADGVAVLLTTQYLEEADRLADTIVLLDSGTVAATGTARELKARVGTLTVQLSFAGPGERAAATDALRRSGLRPGPGTDDTGVGVPVESSAEVPAVVRALDRAGVVVTGLDLSSPTLDDVYLALTRSGQRAPAAAGKEQR